MRLRELLLGPAAASSSSSCPPPAPAGGQGPPRPPLAEGGAPAELPDDCVAAILGRVHALRDAAACRLVCSRWRLLHSQAMRSLQLQMDSQLNHRLFLSFLRTFPNLTALLLPKGCLDVNDEADPESMAVPWQSGIKSDSVLYSIGMHCAHLTRLEIDFHERPDFSTLALERVFEGCPDLEVLRLGNRHLTSLPETLGKLSKLQELHLSMPHLRSLPASLAALPSLCSLSIKETAFLQELGSSIGSFMNLKVLELKDVRTSLPNEIWCLTRLEKLCLQKVWLLPNMPCSTFERLPHLTSLDLKMDNELSDHQTLDFGNLRSLRHLNVSGCSTLLSFEPILIRDSELEELSITGFKYASLLPDLFHGVTALRSLSLNFVWSGDIPAVNLWPASLSMLSRLLVLEIVNCKVTVLPDYIAPLTTLEELCIRHAKFRLDESGLPNSSRGVLRSLRNLKSLELEDGYCILEDLPGCLGDLPALVDLRLSSSRLVPSPDSFSRLTALQTLHFTAKTSNKLPDSFLQLCSLKELTLAYMRSLVSLPLTFGMLTSLQVLKLLNCVLLEGLPESLTSIEGLSYLEIRCCGLRNLPKSMGNLRSLQELVISLCPRMEHIPISLLKLAALRVLVLDGLPKTCVLPSAFYVQDRFKLVLKSSGPWGRHRSWFRRPNL